MRRIFTRLFAMILLVAVLTPLFPVTADAAGRDSTIALEQPGSGTVEPFHVPNMFPGQSVAREFVVETKHSEAIVLHFRGDIRADAQYEKLAEVLKVRVEIQNSLRYDGLLRDMPASLEHSLSAGTNRVSYRVTAWLDTSVGNDYMDKALVADLYWWFEDTTDVAVKLTAEKLMDGQYARGKAFTFVLKDASGKTVSTVKNHDGHIEFDTLYFSAPGTYTYTFQEVKGLDAGVDYDTAVYQAVITVNGDESYTLTYSRNGADYGTKLPRFLNASKGGGSGDPDDYNPSNPKMGDEFPLVLRSTICASSLTLLVCLLLLWKYPKKEEENHA